MGMGMLLSQISAVAVFCGFVLIVKGGESIPYMLDNPDFEKVKMRSLNTSRRNTNGLSHG